MSDDAAQPTHSKPPVLGHMTIELIDNGTPNPIPRVQFSPVGRLTSGWFDKHMPLFCQEIERAQARVRHGTNTQEAAPTSARRRRS